MNHLTRKQYAPGRPVLHNRCIGGEAYVMGIASTEIAERARPGHFVMLTVREGIHPVLPRPFSIYRLLDDKGEPLRRRPRASDGGRPGVFWEGVSGFEVLYKVVGEGTELLALAREGDEVGVMGPCGDGLYEPVLPDGPAPAFVLMVAGGVGIVPLYFSAQELGSRGIPNVLFFGGRSREYLYEMDEFVPLGTKVLTATEDGSHGERGLVTEVLGRFLEEARSGGVEGHPLGSGAVYACGPEAMLAAVKRVAARYGIPSYHSLERRMGCAMGACRGCVVRVATGDGSPAYERVCTEGPVFPGERILL